LWLVRCSVHSRPTGAALPRLSPRQEQQVFPWVNGKDPRQYGLDFGLWTRSVVDDLIEQKFGIQLGQTAMGELLAKAGPVPTKTIPEGLPTRAVARWRREKADGGKVFFWDESGFRADTVHGKTGG
jgi:transposase